MESNLVKKRKEKRKKKKAKNTGEQGCDTFGKVQPLNENVITRQTL